MLTINASSLRATVNDNAAPAAASGAAGDPAGFSSLLRQTQASTAAPQPVAVAKAPSAPAAAADAPAPAHTPSGNHSSAEAKPDAAAAPEHPASEAADEPASNDPTTRTRALLKGRARGADTATPANAASDTAASANKADAAPAADTKSPTSTAPTAAIDPAIAHWLAALQRPAAAEKGSTDATAKSSADGADATATTAVADHKAGAKTDNPALAADATDAKPRGAHLPAGCEALPTAFTATLAEQRQTEPAAPNTSSSAVSATGAAAGIAPAHTPSATDAAAPVTVAIATPVNSPDFAQALGVQMSVLAKDGIQQAELHLNPADMGPVSVQIVMDGTQARVDFGADLAATRHAIEAGLPELASALRDAGFTLAGGGVSQHAGGRRQGGAGDADGSNDGSRRSARAVSSDTVARVGSAARRIVTQGGVDLYA